MSKFSSGYGRGMGTPHPVDVHVGARVRMRRTLLGMTQTSLGEAIGLLLIDPSREPFWLFDL